jgi:hypothetical protein
VTIDQDKLGKLGGRFATGLGATIGSRPGSGYEMLAAI